MSGARDPDDYEPSAGVLYAVAGVALIALAALMVGQIIEAPDLVRVLIAGLAGSGLYLLITGAVARGLQLGRRQPAATPERQRR
jgi:hypothetical protein